MNRLNNELLKLKIWKDTRGTELIEVALVAGLIAVVAIATLTSIGNSIVSKFQEIVGALGG
jgi:Flp pilus assembly pilin Flp